ncbi:MAG TPA: sigma-54 dependent transcriptional regulator, partial [Spirochaetota bacterium]|nr:sigma-54 dependent transcriptional regulator [Spirochaetota bacterium]
DGLDAIEHIQKIEYPLILLDLRMPRMTGIEVLQYLHDSQSRAVPIVITANNDVESAVQSMRLGAYDYIVKPFDNERLLVTVRNALEKKRLENEVHHLREEAGTTGIDGIIAESSAMKKVFSLVHRVLDNDVTLLITGESGTGKEVFARAVHNNSTRKSGPFIALDCASIPETLIENEFFGHEKGAFTGAMTAVPGKFELADGGTLFLDEIGNLRLDVQAKLLRVLQEREFSRIGGTRRIQVDVRIICATNADLELAMRENRFREDLYYRIHVVPIKLPALREREGDVPRLIRHFLQSFNAKMGKSIVVSERAMLKLCQYSWPGNVRELENMIHRLVVIKDSDVIEADDLPHEIRHPEKALVSGFSSSMTLEEVERQHIKKILHEEGNNISRAAQVLGITRKTLHAKLAKLHLE